MKFYLKINAFYPPIEVDGRQVEFQRLTNSTSGVVATSDAASIKVLDQWVAKHPGAIAELSQDQYDVVLKKNSQQVPQKPAISQDPFRREIPTTPKPVESFNGLSNPPVPVAEEHPKTVQRDRSQRSKKIVVSGPTKDTLPKEAIRAEAQKGIIHFDDLP